MGENVCGLKRNNLALNRKLPNAGLVLPYF
jgi:hypothetical protein